MGAEMFLIHLLIVVEATPWQFVLSAVVTAAHTIDESAGRVTIWEWLKVPLPLYLGFQLLQLVLAFLGIVLGYSIFALLLILIRLADTFYTHDYLESTKGISPGRGSAWLLVLDAMSVAFYMFCCLFCTLY